MKIAFITILIGLISTIYNRYNYVIVLLSLELILIGISLLFINTSLILDDFFGLIIPIFLYTLGAAESSIGLTLIILYYISLNKKII